MPLQVAQLAYSIGVRMEIKNVIAFASIVVRNAFPCNIL